MTCTPTSTSSTIYAVYYQIAPGTPSKWGLMTQNDTFEAAVASAFSLAERLPTSFFGVHEFPVAKPSFWDVFFCRELPETLLPQRIDTEPRFIVAGYDLCRPTRRNTPVLLAPGTFQEMVPQPS